MDAVQPFGGYVLLEALGRGATGDVWLARPIDGASGVPEPVVLKRLHGHLAGNEALLRRFVHEAEIAVAVSDPRVVRVYDAGRAGDTLYLAMELVLGPSLLDIVSELRRMGRWLPVTLAAEIVEGVLHGLAALHDAVHPVTGAPLDAVHRDLSPRNILVDGDGVVRLIDLGLGKSSVQTWRTRTGALFGTPGYMAPEQALGQHVDRRADLYAAGVILYELLTLDDYVPRGAPLAMLEASARPVFRAPSRVREGLDPRLDAVAARALALRPEERFPDARSFLSALRYMAPAAQEGLHLRGFIPEIFGEELDRRRARVRVLVDRSRGESGEESRWHAETVIRRQAALPAPRPRRLPAILAAAISLAGGLAIARAMVNGEARSLPLEAPPSPPRELRARAAEREPAPPAAEIEVATPLAPPAKARPRPAVTAPVVLRPEPAAEDDLSARVERLLNRARAARERQPAESSAAEILDQIIMKLALESRSANADRAARRISDIEAQLDDLDRFGGSP